MADIGQVLATGSVALVSATAGAGLTYWFGALNRRHQEAREDETRWYAERFKVYAEVARAYARANYLAAGSPEFKEAVRGFAATVGPILMVGSLETKRSAFTLLRTLRKVGRRAHRRTR